MILESLYRQSLPEGLQNTIQCTYSADIYIYQPFHTRREVTQGQFLSKV